MKLALVRSQGKGLMGGCLLVGLLCNASAASAQTGQAAAAETGYPNTPPGDQGHQATKRHPPRTRVLRNGGDRDFTFSTQQGQDEEGEFFDLEVRYGRAVVLQEQSRIDPLGSDSSEKDVDDMMDNTPRRGCRSIVANSYSGGAHCCFTVIVATSCGSRDYLFKLFHGHGDDIAVLKETDDHGKMMLRLFDQRFAYYDADANHFLSFADSPVGIRRYATWTPQGWRFAAAGELKNIYTKLMNKELHAPGEASYRKVATAITVTYYALMSGMEDAKAKKLLASHLPQEWASMTDTVFTHIQLSIAQFNAKGERLMTIPLPPGAGRSIRIPESDHQGRSQWLK